MDDREIIKMLDIDPSAGVRAAITQYRGLLGKIVSVILTGHEQDIEEVISDTFVTMWKRRHDFDFERGSLKGFLSIVARNGAINRWNQLNRRGEVLTDEFEFLMSEDIVEEYIRREDDEIIQSLIMNFNEPDREIFVRRFYLLESVKNIAAATGLEEKQISNRIYQSKLYLRKELTEREIKL